MCTTSTHRLNSSSLHRYTKSMRACIKLWPTVHQSAIPETCQTSMKAWFVSSRLCWQVIKGYQAERSYTNL